jgi:Transposase
MAPTEFQGENELSRDALAAVEESLESQRQPEGAALHAGPVEHAPGARLVPKGSLPAVLDLQAAVVRSANTWYKWIRSAMRSKLDAFKKFAQMLRSHLAGILPWTKIRVSNGAVEGMNNKITSISHRSFGFRTAENFIAAIYHCCARLPLPVER